MPTALRYAGSRPYAASATAPNENHEPRFMMSLIRRTGYRGTMDSVLTYRSFDMKWETPQAVELRFGMEITMYVSHR
jgi:coenzyme PQQ precursor peptide PqqA